MKAKFHIPDFYIHMNLDLNLIDEIKAHPEYFRDGVEIASCYGCFPPALWNGGRAMAGYYSYERVKKVIDAFNSRGVPIRYTFTNPTLTERDLKDPFCNRICRLAQNGFNEIIVNLPIVEEYVRKHFPQYPIISSTVKQIEGYDALMKELEKDYKLVVLDYNWNNDFERLEMIPMEYRSRCEILICPYCTPHCKRRGEHYRVLGETQRESARNPIPPSGFNPLAKIGSFHCGNENLEFSQIQGFSTFVKVDDVFGKYLEMGFCNFKIEGRAIGPDRVLDSYIYYLVKPEFADTVRKDLMEAPPVIGKAPLSQSARSSVNLISPR